MYTQEIGDRIRERREKLGLTQADLANALQVSAQAVSKWERGENAPDISVIVPLAGLLGVSTDWLLGYHRERQDMVEATVLVSDVGGTSKRSCELSAKELADWINGFQFQVTEAVTQYGGVPVKYLGDGFLAFFSGAEHRSRALDAARRARKVITDEIAIGLSSGDVYLGTIGHPDYASRDIMGNAVNLAFRATFWARRNTASQIAAGASVIDGVEEPGEIGSPQSVEFKGIDTPVVLHEVR